MKQDFLLAKKNPSIYHVQRTQHLFILMEEKKKNSKFVTTILIGGALGSLAALLFRGQVRRNESPVPTKKQKNTFLQRLLGK